MSRVSRSRIKLYDIYFVGLPTTSWRAWLTALPCIVPEAHLFDFTLFGEEGIDLEQREQPRSHAIPSETALGRLGDEVFCDQLKNVAPGTENTEESGRRVVSHEAMVKNLGKHPRVSVESLETEANLLLRAIQQPHLGMKEQRRNVLLVGHGLGSIVIKQALILANAEPKFYEAALRVLRVVTLHSPHTTPSIGAWEDYLWDIIEEASLEFDGRRTEVLADLAVFADSISSHFYCHASQYDLQHLEYKEDIDERHARSILAPLALLNQGSELEETKDQIKFGEKQKKDPAEVREMLLELLSRLSTSTSSIYRTHGLCIPEQVPDIGVYRQFIDQWNDAYRAKQISVQIFGSHAAGRAALLKILVQRLRHWSCEEPAFTLMVLEIPLHSPTRHLIVSSLIRQILSQSPSLFSRFRELYLEHSRKDTWTDETMTNFLFEMFWFLRAWKVVFEIVEFETKTDEMNEFINALARHLASLDCDYVFLVSREEVSDHLPSRKTLDLNIDTTTKESFRKYIQTKVLGLARPQSSLQSVQAEILQQLEDINLPQKSIHLYVSLLSHALPFTTLDAVDSVRQKWSMDADDLYRNSIESLIREQPGVIAWCALVVSCVFHAARPLRLHEIAVAAAIHPVMNNKQSDIRCRITLSIKEDIERYLHFLLRVDNDTVLLLDSSTKDFLLEKLHQHESLRPFKLWDHHQLTSLCLDYLDVVIRTKGSLCLAQLDWKRASKYVSDPELDFLDYAVKHWPIHYRQAKDNGEDLRQRVLSFLEEFGDRWYQLFHPNTPPREMGNSKITVLEIASELGFSSIVRTLLDKADPLNPIDLERAIASAVRANQQTLAEMLLNAGARNPESMLDAARNGNVDLLRALSKRDTKEDNYHRLETSILHTAAQAGRLNVVKEALAVGANVRKTDAYKRTPLHAAVIGGSVEVIECLLKQEGCSIDVQDDEGYSPLMLAARLGQVSALRKLCTAAEEDPTKMAPHWQNVLLVAVREDSPFAADVGSESVKILLSHGRGSMGSSVWRNENDPSTLYHACNLGSFEILKQLIDYFGTGKQIPEDIPGDNSLLLHVAAERGYVEIVRLLLSYVDNLPIVEGKPTAIELASSSGHLPILEMLYSKYPDPGPQTDTELILRACDNGHLPVVRYLLDHQSEPRDGEQALSAAIRKGHLAIVRLLFDKSVTKGQSSDSKGETPLHHAAAAGHIEVARFLIEKGADVNSLSRLRQTPLHLAASRGITGMVQLLLNCYAQADQRTRGRNTALHLAIRCPDIVSLLVKHGAEIDPMNYEGHTPLHLAARGPYYESVKRLINDGGAFVDKTSDKDVTPFHLAIDSKSQPCIQEIWNAKPDMTLDCYKRRPPALYAVEGKRLEALRFLSENCRDTLDMQDEEGMTALFVAVEKNLHEYVEVLLEAKVSTDVQNSENQTPLHRAVACGHPKIVEMLLKAGANTEIRDAMDWTALHLSVENVEIAKLLLDNNAPIDDIGGPKRWTALMRAVFYEDEDCVNLILKYNPALKVQDSRGKTALHIAVEEDLPGILQALVDACNKMGLDVVDMIDGSGATALQYADENPSIALILVRAGADALREDDERNTFFQVAVNDWAPEDRLEIANTCIAQMSKNGVAVDSKEFRMLSDAIRIGSSTVDEDDWCLSHSRHQETDWSQLLKRMVLEMPPQSTNTPTSLMIPYGWAHNDDHRSNVQISSDCSQATYQHLGGPNRLSVLSVRADHPFPPRGIGNPYFEVGITANDSNGIENPTVRSSPAVAIGLCRKSTHLASAFVGWRKTSVAIHSYDGCIYERGHGSQLCEGRKLTFGPGNTVGCGIDWSRNVLYFTLDGKFVGEYESKLLGRKLYPTISFGSGSCCVTANFGKEEFRFRPHPSEFSE